jgi:hypothetical protein
MEAKVDTEAVDLEAVDLEAVEVMEDMANTGRRNYLKMHKYFSKIS